MREAFRVGVCRWCDGGEPGVAGGCGDGEVGGGKEVEAEGEEEGGSGLGYEFSSGMECFG